MSCSYCEVLPVVSVVAFPHPANAEMAIAVDKSNVAILFIILSHILIFFTLFNDTTEFAQGL